MTHGDTVASKAIPAQGRHFPRTRNSGAVGAEPSANSCHQRSRNVTLAAPSPAATAVAPCAPAQVGNAPFGSYLCLVRAVRMEEATSPALLVALPGTFPVLQAFGG